jgi:hypothetical protein
MKRRRFRTESRGNFHVHRSGIIMAITARAVYNKDADFIRLEIFQSSKTPRPGPGQHHGIDQFNKLKFWENHPFTLAASYPTNDETREERLMRQLLPCATVCTLRRRKDSSRSQQLAYLRQMVHPLLLRSQYAL